MEKEKKNNEKKLCEHNMSNKNCGKCIVRRSFLECEQKGKKKKKTQQVFAPIVTIC